jgi:hypothetical protein
MKSALLLLALSACAQSPATPNGPLLSFDRRSTLPAGVDASAALSSYTSTATVCGAEPFPPARVKARWRVARQGEDLYVVDGAVELVEGSPQLVVKAQASSSKAGESLTPGAPWLDVVELDFTCDRQAFRFPKRFEHHLKDLVELHASGRGAEAGP